MYYKKCSREHYKMYSLNILQLNIRQRYGRKTKRPISRRLKCYVLETFFFFAIAQKNPRICSFFQNAKTIRK